MLIIRLQRVGKRNQAEFRLVLAERTDSVSKKAAEVLGHYSARKKSFTVKNGERLQYWLSQRVELSPTVHNLLVANKLMEAGKVKAFNIPKKTAEPAIAPVDQSVEGPKGEATAPAEAPTQGPTTEAKPEEKSGEPAPETPAT